MKIFYLTSLLIFILDRLTKFLILKLENFPIEVTSFLNIVKVWNRGITFGFFQQDSFMAQILLSLLIGILLLFLFFLAKKSNNKDRIFLGMIFGGGLGNLLDRLIFKGVLDFIDFYLGAFHWPAFNLADAFITLGIIFLGIGYVFKSHRK